jgi:Na+/glutamate symporter
MKKSKIALILITFGIIRGGSIGGAILLSLISRTNLNNLGKRFELKNSVKKYGFKLSYYNF